MNLYLFIFAILFVGMHAKSSNISSFCEVFQQCPLVASVPEMKTEIEGLKAEVQKLKTSIAFYASISRSIPMSQLHTHMILKYDTVELNHGNGYNKNSGMFTAPVTGLYMFFVTNNAADYTTISFNVVKNNVVKNQGISDAISTGARLSVTLATPVPLVSGDTVSVLISYLRAKHAYGLTSDHIHDECSFSGYKIN